MGIWTDGDFQALINTANGGRGAHLNYTGISDDSNYALDAMNVTAGTGGARLRGASGAALLVKDATVEATGNFSVTGAIDATSTLTGTRLIATIATGTAPLGISSTTLVTNLNADLLDGQHAAAFLTQALADLRYLQLTGGTLTGALTIQANQGLKLQNSVTAGVFVLNSTNVADPSLEFKDASGDNMVVINPSGSTYALDVNNGTLATNAARFTGDVLVVDDLGVNNINATGDIQCDALTADGSASFNASINVDGGAIIDTISLNGTGTVFSLIGSSQTQTTVGGAGGASALPATPRGYIKIVVGASDRLVPYYDA